MIWKMLLRLWVESCRRKGKRGERPRVATEERRDWWCILYRPLSYSLYISVSIFISRFLEVTFGIRSAFGKVNKRRYIAVEIWGITMAMSLKIKARREHINLSDKIKFVSIIGLLKICMPMSIHWGILYTLEGVCTVYSLKSPNEDDLTRILKTNEIDCTQLYSSRNRL